MAILPLFCFLAGALVSRATLAIADSSGSVLDQARDTDCRCFPGEPCWPTEAGLASFNYKVGGRLIATIPIAACCHRSNLAPYDADACEALRSSWWYPETHLRTSSSPMAPFFANASCDPFTAPDEQCVVGAYV